MVETVTIGTPEGDMAVFDAATSEPARGGVVVLQDVFGLNDYLRNVCGQLAAEGYRAVAPQLYHRDAVMQLDYAPAEEVMRVTPPLTARGVLMDVSASLEYLYSTGLTARRTGVIGFCLGGTLAFAAATENALGGAVTFYGAGIRNGRRGFSPLAELAPDLRTPWLGLYGDQDVPSKYGHGIPIEEVEELRAAAQSARVPTEIVRYPDAGHAFHCDPRPTYHEASARDAWKRTLAWLENHVAGAE